MVEPFGIPLSSLLSHRRIAVFADMENISIRSKRLLPIGHSNAAWVGMPDVWTWSDSIHEVLRMWGTVVRTYAFTTASGDPDAIMNIVRAMKKASISVPEVVPKASGKSKKVDIALASQMLRQSFLGNFDTAVLLTGDGDFVPLVKAVQDMGKAVVILAFSDGLSADLQIAADECYLLDGLVTNGFRAIEVCLAPRLGGGHVVRDLTGNLSSAGMIEIPLSLRRTGDSGPGTRQVLMGGDFGQAFTLGRLKISTGNILIGTRSPGAEIRDQDVAQLETYAHMDLNAASISLRWTDGGTKMNDSDRWFEIHSICADKKETTRFLVVPKE